jgi:hypothetical protein
MQAAGPNQNLVRETNLGALDKLSESLSGVMSEKNYSDFLSVAVWFPVRDSRELSMTVAERYPDLHVDGLRTFEDTDMTLYEEFYAEFFAEMKKEVEEAASGLVEYLRGLGYDASVSAPAPIVFAEIPKAVIYAVAERPDVAFLDYAGGRLVPT